MIFLYLQTLRHVPAQHLSTCSPGKLTGIEFHRVVLMVSLVGVFPMPVTFAIIIDCKHPK